jgi:hypothetical protein
MTAVSLHVGVSSGGGRLRSPAVDARDLAAAAAARGLGVQRVLIDAAATRDAFLRELAAAAARVGAGDTLLITFSGHGRESGWCLADGELPLAEICAALPRAGYISIIVDACHAGALEDRQSCLSSLSGQAGLPVLQVIVLAACGANSSAKDGHGPNTRSPFTAALLRMLVAGPCSFGDVSRIAGAEVHRLTPMDPAFERAGPFRVVAAPSRSCGARSSSGTSVRRSR